MYEPRKQEDILQELQDNSTNDRSKYEGTFEYDIFSSNSIEFAKQEIERFLQYIQAYGQTATDEYLDYKCWEHGITRKQAVKAIGIVTVKGNGLVPLGSIFATASGVSFGTTKEVRITKKGDIPVEAINAGIKGNVEPETITVIPMSIPGISSVVNQKATYDGFDEETDDELRARLEFKVQQPATSGNVNHYKLWAMDVEGVGKATVIPIWNGPGTVKVIIIDSNNNPASDDLIKKVYDYIETQRPIGATLTVVAPIVVNVNISLKVLKGKGNIDGIKKVISRYFISSNFDGTVISYAQIGSNILSNSNETQVLDYTNLRVNDGVDNIPLTNEQMPVVGEVVFNG